MRRRLLLDRDHASGGPPGEAPRQADGVGHIGVHFVAVLGLEFDLAGGGVGPKMRDQIPPIARRERAGEAGVDGGWGMRSPFAVTRWLRAGPGIASDR
jgi:hypothetical protein